MQPSTLVLLSVPLLAVGQHIRNLRPRERIGEVPEEITQVRDRQLIRTFIAERSRHEATFLKRAMSACALLIDGSSTVEEFTAHLDVTDARMDMDVEQAYSSMITTLTPIGKSELDAALARVTGPALEELSFNVLAHKYEQVCQLRREWSEGHRSKASGENAT